MSTERNANGQRELRLETWFQVALCPPGVWCPRKEAIGVQCRHSKQLASLLLLRGIWRWSGRTATTWGGSGGSEDKEGRSPTLRGHWGLGVGKQRMFSLGEEAPGPPEGPWVGFGSWGQKGASRATGEVT